MACPDGLQAGFGLPAEWTAAMCVTRSCFGQNQEGLIVYAAGTGFLVGTNGRESLVLTAAHNVYHPVLRRPAAWVSLFFGRRGDSSEASRDMQSASYPSEYDEDSSAPAAWDFAMMRVTPLDPARFAPLPLSLSTTTQETRKLLVGYPTEGACQGRFQPYNATLFVSPSSPDNYRYRPQETYAGMSGGPLLTTGAPFSSFGLHIRGGEEHRAIRFSPKVMARIDSWRAGSAGH